MYVAAICSLVIVVYMLSCMFHREPPKRGLSPEDSLYRYMRDNLPEETDASAFCWRGKA